MRRIQFSLSLILFGLFMLTVNAHCQEWISLAENNIGHFLYDKTSISETDDGMIIVVWKTDLSIDAAKSAADALPMLKGVSLTLYHDIINCRERTYKYKRIQYYDNKGKLLGDTKTDEAKYQPPQFRAIPYDSPIERLADIVCK